MARRTDLKPALKRLVHEEASKRVEDPSDVIELKLTELQVLEELRGEVPSMQQDVVDVLRSGGVTWMALAKAAGLAFGAAVQRWRAGKPDKVPKNPLPGKSVDDAAAELGTHASKVRSRVNANPDAKWHTRVPVEGPRKSVLRIVDVRALSELLESRPKT